MQAHVVAANGGHEYPMLRKANGDFELFREKHGMVLGALKRKTYAEYEFDLEPGGTLFVYTDGAPEATDAQEKMFGTDRIKYWNGPNNRSLKMKGRLQNHG